MKLNIRCKPFITLQAVLLSCVLLAGCSSESSGKPQQAAFDPDLLLYFAALPEQHTIDPALLPETFRDAELQSISLPGWRLSAAAEAPGLDPLQRPGTRWLIAMRRAPFGEPRWQAPQLTATGLAEANRQRDARLSQKMADDAYYFGYSINSKALE